MTTLEKAKTILLDGGQREEDFNAFKEAREKYLAEPVAENSIALHLAFGTVHRDIKWAHVAGRISREDFELITEYFGNLDNGLE